MLFVFAVKSSIVIFFSMRRLFLLASVINRGYSLDATFEVTAHSTCPGRVSRQLSGNRKRRGKEKILSPGLCFVGPRLPRT
uniref:Putative secreted protein n=1 Tax=Ixodes ricinus TaxID=34613 RepID=A0A6B0TYD0_IXORI